MRALLVILLVGSALASQCLCGAVADDQAVRYVNGEVITLADVYMRGADRLSSYAHDAPARPQGRPETIAFMEESLDQLTDEQLMVQKAQSLKLIPDHDKVVLEVLELSKESGTGLSLADQARARKIRERQQSIDFLLTYFYDIRTPQTTPAQLWEAYQSHQEEFRRAARARVLLIMLRPSDPSVAKDLQRAKIEIFKQLQDAPDAAIAKIGTSRMDRFLATEDKSEQEHLLDDSMSELAAAAVRTDLDAKSHDLVLKATDLKSQEDGIRTLDQQVAELTRLRATISGKGEEAFRALAQRVSQGPHATEGGDQGWKDQGEFPDEVDSRIFALPANGLSDVFTANQAAWLILIAEREPSRVKSFGEVLGVLETSLHRDRRADMRKKVAAILRLNASITTVIPIASLVPE
jgi:hypothetical protein